ncbi:MAG: response regulator transcription factor [Chloroflexi bacterium]|nr:response regulator transcription factor [Chloroflexota bacterium]
MPSLLIIEDERGIRDSLREGLSYQGYEVQGAATGNAGLTAARDKKPDLVILDLMLPDIDGLEVCRRLRGMGDMAILMLTARDGLADRVKGLDAGADDYLVKPFAFDELLARVRAVLRRRTAPTTEAQAIAVGNLRIDTAAHQVSRGDRAVELTPKEYELLALLASNKGRVLKKEQILERVWGYDTEADSDALKVTVNHLRAKLNADGEPDLIQTIRGFGYLLKEPA